ncbi:MAG: hypothetical protein KQI78_02890 [Deltaproteobacteria bacterium]|jgi:hypothetical protein|nr:hypothetical protein [Deltaproteobacteria bacterium]
MIPPDLLGQFQKTLPLAREWVAATLKAHRDQVVPVDPMDYRRLRQVFPGALLKRARAVVVTDNPPFPPLSRMGLPEFAAFEAMPISGVTYQDTFFVRDGYQTESLYFHEMVHVVQWDRLGVDHKRYAEKECRAMLVEPAGTRNTGGTGGAMTADDNVWI